MSAFAGVGRNSALRRLELAALGSYAGDWAYGVALAVYAYQQGGAGTVGLVLAVRLGLGAVAAPFLSAFADRFDRLRVLLLSVVSRMVLTAVGGVMVLS